MKTGINELFGDSHFSDNVNLDIETPKSQKAVTNLPPGFQIKTIADIEKLEEYVAHRFATGIRLYRGHESKDYKLQSSITRLVKSENKDCSFQDVCRADRVGFDYFCNNVFKKEWLQHKLKTADESLFKMSIGRHLGLPCRLIDVTASLKIAIWFAVMNPRFFNKDGEVMLIVLDKNSVSGTNQSPFDAVGLSYAHEPFVTDFLDDLPLGEQRRFVQDGHFIWIDNSSLLNEEQTIKKSAFYVQRFTIPWQAKLLLATGLYRDVYSGFACQSEIEKIRNNIKKQIKEV